MGPRSSRASIFEKSLTLGLMPWNGVGMWYFYVIQSQKDLNYFYKGSTYDLVRRLASHNSGDVFSSAPYRPYKLVYYEAYVYEFAARVRESGSNDPCFNRVVFHIVVQYYDNLWKLHNWRYLLSNPFSVVSSLDYSFKDLAAGHLPPLGCLTCPRMDDTVYDYRHHLWYRVL